MAIIALLLVILAGFAAQRGSICAVAAVNDLVLRRKARRYVAFLECAAWSLAILTAARSFGFAPAAPLHGYAAGVSAALGGALFGLGAAVNGACTFGSAARLGRGEVAFAAMPAGFLGGVALASALAAAPIAVEPAPIAQPAIVVTALVFFVGFEIFRASDNAASPHRVVDAIASPEWHPSLAMAAIGVSSGLLMIFFAPWPYSSLLVDLGASATSDHLALKIALALFFVVGAALGAHTRRTIKLVEPRPRDILEKAAGGALMGAGSFLVPGGNDSMVLVGLPHLFGYAAIAYIAMSASIAAIALVGARAR